MSEENVELHRRVNAAFNRRDLDAWLALGDTDIEFSAVLVAVEGGRPYHGHDGARRFWRDLFDAFPDLRVEVEEIRDLGDTTFASARLVGHGAGSEAAVERPVWHVVEWRNQKCVRFRSFPTETEALEAAGLSE